MDHDDERLLDVLLDSWDRNNRILIGLLRALPEGGLEVRSVEAGHSVADLFAHMHYVRLVFAAEDAPEVAVDQPEGEWSGPQDEDALVAMLTASASAVRSAVKGRVESGRPMELHYDHPILMLQHLIWHEGYHHGQIKLALKLAGRPMSNKIAGPVTWRIWMNKR